MYVKTPAAVTLTFTGLSASETYSFVFYGARGNPDGKDLFTVAGGNGTFNASIDNVLNNATSAPSVTGVTADGAGNIVITYTSATAAGGTAKDGGLNYIQMTSVPEPSTSLLLGAFGLFGLLLRRR